MKTDVTKRFQQVVGPIIAIGLLAYFVYHLIQGERGILSWRRLKTQITVAEEKLNKTQEEQQGLEQRVQLMRPDSLDPDMLEEQAREKLNFARKDEVIIRNEEFEK